MHILLTDILTCPRCGPTFGLILLSDELSDRQVISGHLGCPNCRQSYPIEDGVADLRYGPVTLHGGSPSPDDPERAFRLAALMGVTAANANLLVLDGASQLAESIAGILPQAHIIAVSTGRPGPVPPEGFISRVVVSDQLPFRSASLRGAVCTGDFILAVGAEMARTLMPGARLVVDPAGDQVADELRSLGLRVDLEQDRVVVAAAPGPV